MVTNWSAVMLYNISGKGFGVAIDKESYIKSKQKDIIELNKTIEVKIFLTFDKKKMFFI